MGFGDLDVKTLFFMFSWDEVKFDFCRFLLSLFLELVRGFKFIKLNNFNSILDMIFIMSILLWARACVFYPRCGPQGSVDSIRFRIGLGTKFSYELGTDSIWDMN